MTKKKSSNSLQAILDRASTAGAAAQADAPAAEEGAAPKRASGRGRRPTAAGGTTTRAAVTPARAGTKMIGGHFPPEVSTRLRLLAVEEDTTVQALLEEAINDLLTKKAGRKPR